jgi:uncharacterized protein YndB with AHSA1/START domain
MSTKHKPQPPLVIRRTINATRERVFEAFENREQMDKWMCRDAASHVITYLKFDFREGGGFTLDIGMPGGEKYLQLATYKAIVKPEKIVFLWEGEHYNAAGKEIGELRGTVVTFEFLKRGDSTELVLTHEFLPSEGEFSGHEGGWNGCIDKLSTVVADSFVKRLNAGRESN